ncbi:MAG: decaprenyl-phosphate phosphoribosyltransferase [Ignavibacteriales bacterium]|nr:decaprenyl-phosphate phosphoribosyltransferase [Ignavibacteriales bacterium]
MRKVVRLMRPEQWLKNFFIFAPLIFSKHLFDGAYVWMAAQAFLVFALLSSTVYIFNDIADREADRLHPTKRNRPIAAGTITITQAVGLAIGLMLVIGFLVTMLNAKFLFVAVVYFVLNLGYSFFLKRVILVDVFIVAAGFMLRVLAGAFAIHVQVSEWLVLCTLFVSLFLSISKRRAELMLVKNSEHFEGRAAIRGYDIEFLDQMMTIAASGMAISYALYTVAERTISIFGSSNLIFTTVFVLFGIFRYLYLVRARKTEDNPTHMLTTDPVTLVNGVAWFSVCVIIIYFSDIKIWLGVR